VGSALFRTKSPELLISEADAPERVMKRTLSAFALTCLGIGAIIGSGIFALTGTAAAGQEFASKLETPVSNYIVAWWSHADLILGRSGAGPAIAISFVIAGLACAFAALCYAELAAMIPVSGSAYTYSYATLGEFIAWIIGWDLILEYAVGNMAVAASWSGYFVQLCGSLFKMKFPLWAVTDYRTATDLIAKGGEPLQSYSSVTLPILAGHAFALNLPAFLIVAAVTTLLIYGIRESARANTTIVIIKVAVVVFFISFGAFLVNPTHWHPYMPYGFSGVMSGAAIVFFAFIGFDAVSTCAEETRNPKRDVPIGIIASLIICTILYVLMSMVLTGMGGCRAGSHSFRWPALGAGAGQCRRARRYDFGPAGLSTWATAHFHGDGPRRSPAPIFRTHPSAFSNPVHYDHLDWCGRGRGCDGDRHWFTGRPNQYRHSLRLYSGLPGRGRSSSKRTRTPSPVPCSDGSVISDPRCPALCRLDD